MGRQIIRVAKDDPRYLVWDTIVGMPVMFGERKETLRYLIQDYAKGTDRRKREKADAKRRLALADEYGGDAAMPFLVNWSPSSGKTYLQAGFLPRRNLAAWCDRMEAFLTDHPTDDWTSRKVTDQIIDLLEPLGD